MFISLNIAKVIRKSHYSTAFKHLSTVMGRDNQKFNKKNNFNRNKGRFNKPVDNTWQTDKRLMEHNVGITQYVSDIEGFHGVIKARYSDFQVNEIDLEGKEAVLTDFSIPKPEDFETSTEPGENVKMQDYIDEEKIKEIAELIAGEDYHKSVLIEVTDCDKNRRSEVHKALRQEYGKKTTNNTITTGTGRKFIQIKKFVKGDQEQRGWKWPHEYVYFVLYKENLDTMQAVSLLAQNLRIKASSFNFAGTKDKRAKTTQWICVKKIDPSKICQAACRIRIGGKVKVGNFKFEKEPLKLGMLSGNRFQIALRSVKGDENLISESLKSIRDNGFINYYGMQRFGNCVTVPTFEIGKALLRSDFKEAVDLILKEREGEPPFMSKMRACWTETRDAEQSLKIIKDQHSNYVEARLLSALAKTSDKGNYNYFQALKSLPRNTLMLYTHAYQSLIFNQVASKRRQLGLTVMEGDLVYRESIQSAEAEEILVPDIIDDVDDEREEVSNEVTETESKFKNMVRVLTKEDVESGKFSIFDIVLVLPGHDITYPANSVGEYYEELMAKDDLSSEKLKNKHKIFSLGGAYRKAFVKPKEFSWQFLRYSDQNDDLILSDYSRLMKDEEIQSKLDGEHLAVILKLELPQSCYATMALREILRSDTSVGQQMQYMKRKGDDEVSEIPEKISKTE